MKDRILRSAKALGFKNSPVKLNQYNNFIRIYDKWIKSSEQNVKGLPGKPYVVSGITDAINQLYGLYNIIGIYDGEYMHHQNVLGDRVTTDLSKADCIVISHPFSGDGKCSHDKLKEADSYGVPIFVDCAFFGICYGIDFNFEQYKNIHSVCFSLSKTFGTGFNRVGLLYTIDKFPVTLYEEWNYPLMSSAEHHYNLIVTIGPDDMPKKYLEKQKLICEELGIEPTPTIIFGVDYSKKYSEFNRGPANRICITNLLEDK